MSIKESNGLHFTCFENYQVTVLWKIVNLCYIVVMWLLIGGFRRLIKGTMSGEEVELVKLEVSLLGNFIRIPEK